jgi:DNA-binding transcriptional MerR regulator
MEFFASDVTKILGIKRTTLQQWMEYGFLGPSVQEAQGSGVRNIYSLGDLYKIATFNKLLHLGLNREQASLWIRGFDFEELSEKQTGSLIIVGRFEQNHSRERFFPLEMYIENGEEVHLKLGGAADAMIVVNFKKIAQEVNERIKR